MDISQATELVEQTLYPLVLPEYESVPAVGRMLCEVLPGDDALMYGERIDSVTDFGMPDEIGFGVEPPDRSAVSGWKVWSKTRKLAHKVTLDVELFDAMAASGRMASFLTEKFAGQGSRFAEAVEAKIFGYIEKGALTAGDRNYFDQSFPGEDPTYTLVGYDGVPLYDTAHPLKLSSTTPSNHTASSALTHANLETALILIEKTSAIDERGQQISNMMDTLLVPTNLSFTARRILGSELQSGVAQNDTNVLRNRLQVLESPRIADTDAWFLFRLNSGRKALRMRDWGPPRVVVYDDFRLNKRVIELRKYYSLTHQDWRGTAAFNIAA
jgi:hypothetical protein